MVSRSRSAATVIAIMITLYGKVVLVPREREVQVDTRSRHTLSCFGNVVVDCIDVLSSIFRSDPCI